AQIYSELFLRSYHGGSRVPTARPLPGAAQSPEALDVLLDALHDTCQWIRDAAGEACWSIALAHPGWFAPRHYTRLLPFLSDEDRGVRLCVMKTFQALAGYRSQQAAPAAGTTSRRRDSDPEEEEEEEEKATRRDLEVALGITLDR